MRALTVYNLFAATCCGLLGAWVYHEIQRPTSPLYPVDKATAKVETNAGTAVGTVHVGPPQVFRPAPKNTYAQLVTRPPFSPTRRPPRAKPVTAPADRQLAPEEALNPLDVPQVTLVGIVISSEHSIAMVQKPGAVELLRLAKGQDLDGWLVKSVQPDRLLLSHGEQLLELELTETGQVTSRPGTP